MLSYELQQLNAFLEGFVIEDFVPKTYDCLYSGVLLEVEGHYLHEALKAARHNSNIS